MLAALRRRIILASVVIVVGLTITVLGTYHFDQLAHCRGMSSQGPFDATVYQQDESIYAKIIWHDRHSHYSTARVARYARGTKAACVPRDDGRGLVVT
jgi:hypothetical protein